MYICWVWQRSVWVQLWSLVDKKIIQSRDIVFHERMFPSLETHLVDTKDYVPMTHLVDTKDYVPMLAFADTYT